MCNGRKKILCKSCATLPAVKSPKSLEYLCKICAKEPELPEDAQ